MLKLSRLVPAGTADSVNAGGVEEHRATPVQEKLSDIAIASEHSTSTAMVVVRTAVTVATWRFALNETSYLQLYIPILTSEARLISARNVGVAAVVIILMGVFSADNFWPRVGPRYVSKRRGPRRREDPLILDRQLKLQVPRWSLKTSLANSEF
jgi:hypothetical protein